MKRAMSLCIMMMLFSSSLSASGEGDRNDYFRKGLYLGLDFSVGSAVNENSGRARNTCYGTDVALGYRFCPQMALAVGVGTHAFSNRTLTCGGTVPRKVENTCVPVCIRLRSDLLDRKVSPYVQVDMGYSFMFMYDRTDRGEVRYCDTPFSNGRNEYIVIDDCHTQYGMDGLFASIEFGVGWQVIGRLRMNLGLSAGIHRAFLGTSFRTTQGDRLRFGLTEPVSAMRSGERMAVRIVGKPGIRQSMEPSARVKVSFSF